MSPWVGKWPQLGGTDGCQWQRRGASPVLTRTLSLQVAAEAPSHQPSGKLRHWLQKLETAKKTVRQEAGEEG